jgi:hypothetical protein
MAGPGVSDPFGSTNQQNGIGIGRDDDGHRGPKQGRIVIGDGRVVGQALAEAS